MKQIAIRRRYQDDHEIITHETELLERQAEIAWGLTEKWGMVAGKPDGEDTSGRMKLALLTPEEVVKRACDTADLLVKEFQHRGWTVKGPDIKDLLKVEKIKD